METGIQTLVAGIRRLADVRKAHELNDRQLLEQFAGGEEAAFTILVQRYGGLVMSVCQRIVKHTQDAEDAFQATFMVLSRKAGKIAWEESVANWLHGVAYRISCQIRGEKAQRLARERARKDTAITADDPAWSEVRSILDEELDRLPKKYRIPLILCYLEGKSRDEAAAVLGWTAGSVKGRLERGRELLHRRLLRRGLSLSAVLAATLMIGASAKAAVPLTLALETVRAGMAMLAGQTAGVVSSQVLILAQGALHNMFMTKLKISAAAVLILATLGIGTGYVTHQALAGSHSDSQASSASLIAADSPEYVAQREARKALPNVVGVVQETDAVKNTITIVTSREKPNGETYEIAKDAKIVARDGRETKPAKLADVQPKARVSLVLDEGKKIVQSIEIQGARAPDAVGERGRRDAAGATVFGNLEAVDAVKRTVTLQTFRRGEAPASTSDELTKDAKITIRQGKSSKEAKLTDLELMKPVQLRLDDAKKLVQAIEVVISTTASGSVSEVNTSKNTITVTNSSRRGSDDLKSETYELAKDAKVFYQLPSARDRTSGAITHALKLADVTEKTNVTLQLDDARKIIQSINVHLPTVRGTLQSVDAAKNTILLRPGRGDDIGLDIAKDAKIIVNGKEGKLDAVTVAAEAQVILTPDRTKVLVLQSPPPAGR